jgi:Do/DeqQ family serine protease
MNRFLAAVIFALAFAGSWSMEAGAGPPVAVGGKADEMATLAPVLKKVTPSVVNVAIKGRVAQQQNPLLKDPFFRRFFDNPDQPTEREIQAAGSGVVIDAHEGLIITNNHVVEHADEITIGLSDGRHLQGKRVGGDSETDVAVIKVQAEGLTAIPLGDSDRLEVGDFVIAIGNPFQLGQTVTSGIVSGLRRSGLGIERYEDFIQTDASINPGNSGGALISLRGELIGINTAIVGTTGSSVGIGFAIPINMARGVADQIVKYGEVRRGRLGIAILDPSSDLIRQLRLTPQQAGAVIAKVDPGSAAERAGLKAGDVITAIGGIPVRGSVDLRNKIALLRVGEETEFTVLRDNRSMLIRASVAERAKAEASPK